MIVFPRMLHIKLASLSGCSEVWSNPHSPGFWDSGRKNELDKAFWGWWGVRSALILLNLSSNASSLCSVVCPMGQWNLWRWQLRSSRSAHKCAADFWIRSLGATGTLKCRTKLQNSCGARGQVH
jgi:hypothetical protein